MMNNEMQLVIIEWEDSSAQAGWHNVSPDIDCIAIIETVGIVCQETDKIISVALSKSSSGAYGEVLTIPKCCIKSTKKLIMGM